MSWLKTHLEEFVYPVTGRKEITPLGYFKPRELSIIKNAWRAFKKQARGKQILLPGRDVFVFEILARRENYPTIFMPEISRKTSHSFSLSFIDTKIYLLDTGFMGSIPGMLGISNYKMLSHYKIGSNIQIFPHLQIARWLALKIEETPKYWETAYIEQEKIHQVKSDFSEFLNAARLTVEVYTNSAPCFSKE